MYAIRSYYDLAHGDRVAINQPAIGREGFAFVEAEHAPLVGHRVDPEAFFLLRALDGHAELARQFGGGTGMVDVTMRQQDLLHLDAGIGHRRLDPVDITPRISYNFV